MKILYSNNSYIEQTYWLKNRHSVYDRQGILCTKEKCKKMTFFLCLNNLTTGMNHLKTKFFSLNDSIHNGVVQMAFVSDMLILVERSFKECFEALLNLSTVVPTLNFAISS